MRLDLASFSGILHIGAFHYLFRARLCALCVRAWVPTPKTISATVGVPGRSSSEALLPGVAVRSLSNLEAACLYAFLDIRLGL